MSEFLDSDDDLYGEFLSTDEELYGQYLLDRLADAAAADPDAGPIWSGHLDCWLDGASGVLGVRVTAADGAAVDGAIALI